MQKLLTKEQEAKLLANGRASAAKPGGIDHKPVVKFFGGGACTWLLSELDPEEPDIAFGLCDLGMGFPELGSVRLSELAELRFKPFGLPIEREIYWEAEKTLGEYADEASKAGRITA